MTNCDRPARRRPSKAEIAAEAAVARGNIDLDELEEIAAIGCTRAEAAKWFGATLVGFRAVMKEEPYAAAWRRGVGKGRVRLRRAQFELAEKNASMAALLGRRILDQNEHRKPPNRQRGADAAPTIIVDTGIRRDDGDDTG